MCCSEVQVPESGALQALEHVEEPQQKNDRQRNADQPEKSTFEHRAVSRVMEAVTRTP
jgi:hypothetical protein